MEKIKANIKFTEQETMFLLLEVVCGVATGASNTTTGFPCSKSYQEDVALRLSDWTKAPMHSVGSVWNKMYRMSLKLQAEGAFRPGTDAHSKLSAMIFQNKHLLPDIPDFVVKFLDATSESELVDFRQSKSVVVYDKPNAVPSVQRKGIAQWIGHGSKALGMVQQLVDNLRFLIEEHEKLKAEHEKLKNLLRDLAKVREAVEVYQKKR